MDQAAHKPEAPEPEGFAEWWAGEMRFWNDKTEVRDVERLKAWSKAAWAASAHRNSKQ